MWTIRHTYFSKQRLSAANIKQKWNAKYAYLSLCKNRDNNQKDQMGEIKLTFDEQLL